LLSLSVVEGKCFVVVELGESLLLLLLCCVVLLLLLLCLLMPLLLSCCCFCLLLLCCCVVVAVDCCCLFFLFDAHRHHCHGPISNRNPTQDFFRSPKNRLHNNKTQ